MDWGKVGVTKIRLLGKHAKGRSALVDGDYDGEYLSQYKWYLSKNGYPYRTYSEGGIRKTVYLHNLVQPCKKGYWVDHINRDKLDNRSCNLRVVTPKESAKNRRGFDGKTIYKQSVKINTYTGYRGVHNPVGHIKTTDGTILYKKRYSDRFYVMIKGKRIGLYADAVEAARAYDKAAYAAFGDKAILNFPIEK